MMRILALALALLLSNAPAFAAVTYDTFSVSSCTGCTEDGWDHTTTGAADTFMLCGGGFQDLLGGSSITVTYNAAALTEENTAGTEFRAFMHGRVAPTSGTNPVVLTYSQIANSATGCMTFSAVHQGTPVGTSATDADSDGSLSASITILADGLGASFAGYNENGSSCTDSTSGQTERFQECDGNFEVQGMGSTGSEPMTWTLADTVAGAMVAVGINPAAAGGSDSQRIIVIQ